MSDPHWMTLLSILTTIVCCLLGILIVSLRMWKKEIRGEILAYCKENEKIHDDLWTRVNHHYHNGGGNVVIPTTGPRLKE
jgi:hypothetical protein